MRSILTGMTILGCLAAAGAALADEPAGKPFVFVLPKTREAHDHLRRGVRLYNNQSFESAIEEFKVGALAEPCSTFDYNLGQAYRQLGKYKEALWHYQRFLNYGQPTGNVLEAVQQWITEMQAHLANAALTVPPTGASSETAQSRAQGTLPATTDPARGATHDVGQHVATLRDDHGGAIHWVGWTVTGGGIAAIGAAGFLFLRASNLDDQANVDLDTRVRNELHDQASTRRLAGAIVGVGGMVLAATGVYMLATQAYQRDRSTTASVDLGVTSRGVVVFGRF